MVSPYTTPPALRWLQDVYPNLTGDDYQPIECIQVTYYRPSAGASVTLLCLILTYRKLRTRARRYSFQQAGGWPR